MPRIKEIAEKFDEYIEVLKKRYLMDLIPIAEEGVKLWEIWRKYNKIIQNLRAEKNKITKEFAKTRDEKLKERAEDIDIKIREYELGLKEIEKRIKNIELRLPNWITEEVPIGPNEEYLKVIRYFGKPKVYKEFLEDFKKENPGIEPEVVEYKPMHHYDIIREFDLADTDLGGEIAGSRFYFEKNKLVFLDFALTMYALKFFKDKGFNMVIIPPYFMRRDVEEKITYFETFQEAIFSVKEEDLILIPTSEHPICAMYINKTLLEKDLPLRILAWSPAFRREAGAHGKDTKGIFRVKQFHKVELHSITTLDQQFEELDYIIKTVEEFMQTLEIPFRTVILPSGDMDKRALIQYDIQTWFPGQNKYRETHSIATMGTWVSEKIGTRVQRKEGKEFVANLYATGVAVQRTLLAIFENHYDPEEGVIRIPRVLTKYLDFDVIEKK